ncbi:MAG TPA: hypothetical protein VLJ15_05315 [Gammaproteobacteria bacterium]|nr:hypothetical protein [Gammaproteobacteria bacterium]
MKGMRKLFLKEKPDNSTPENPPVLPTQSPLASLQSELGKLETEQKTLAGMREIQMIGQDSRGQMVIFGSSGFPPVMLSDEAANKIRKLVGDDTLTAEVAVMKAAVLHKIGEVKAKLDSLREVTAIGLRFFQATAAQFNRDLHQIVYDYLGVDADSVASLSAEEQAAPQARSGILGRLHR